MTYRSVISTTQSVLAFVGAGVAMFVYVAKTRYGDVPCINGSDSCTLVTTGPYSHIGPIDLSLLGIAAYVTILLCAIVKTTAVDPQLTKRLQWALLAITLFGFCFSWFLQWEAKYVIHEFCIYCRTSAIIMTLLFLLSTNESIHAVRDHAPQPVSAD